MLSYRHAFHAGNHADVLKHFVLIQLLDYLNQKDTAYTYIDTHSGAGVYALDGNYASKNAEYDTGIGPLWDRTDMPAPLARYVELVKSLNPSGKMRYYPGSPYCADRILREQDRLRLFELHPADSKLLADNFRKLEDHAAEQGIRPSARGKRVLVERGDGFAGIKKLLPPPSRRGIVLIDPPYEDKQDYRKVRDMLDDALVRFSTGTYAVWYPVLQRMESRQFADKLKRVQCKEWLHVTLTISTPGPDGFGLHSSGMFVLNPPYTLEPVLREVMPYLVQALGKDAGASFRIEKGVPLSGAQASRSAAGAPRMPVGNARRASPTSGAGSLRLPGQKPPGQGTAPAGAAPSGKPSSPAAPLGKAASTVAPSGKAPARKEAKPGAADQRPPRARSSGTRRP